MDARTALLDTALDLFVRHGYPASGVQAICEQSGLTKPTLYHYFSSKTGLLEQLLERELSPLLALLKIAAVYEKDLPQTLWLITDGFFAFFKNRVKTAQLLLTLIHTPKENDCAMIAAPYTEKVAALFIELFLKAENQHGNFRGRSIRYGYSFLGLLLTYLRLWSDGDIRAEEKDLRDMVHQFSHGIYS